MIQIDIKDYIKDIVPIIGNTMGIRENSLCFCGSGERYNECCSDKSKYDIIFLESAFSKASEYKFSQGNKIKQVPVGIYQEMKKNSLNRLKCLYPDCDIKPCDCHLIPRNILDKCFGKFCLEYQMRDGEKNERYLKRGINRAMILPVFCAKHDNNLFQRIDKLEIDFNNKEQLFSLALKTISFSLRKIQYLLGIDIQAQFFAIKWIFENQEIKVGENYKIDAASLHLQEQYIRFSCVYNAFKSSIGLVIDKKYNYLGYFHRSISYTNNIFFSGLINLSHDLEGIRINTLETIAMITCNIFTKDNQLHILLCYPGTNDNPYKNFFQQLQEIEEKILITIINNIMTIAGEKPLLPIYSPIEKNMGSKTKKMQKNYKECMKRSSNKIFNLKEDKGIIPFIKNI